MLTDRTQNNILLNRSILAFHGWQASPAVESPVGEKHQSVLCLDLRPDTI